MWRERRRWNLKPDIPTTIPTLHTPLEKRFIERKFSSVLQFNYHNNHHIVNKSNSIIFEQCSVGKMTPISRSSVKFHEISVSRLTAKEIDLLVNNCAVPHHQIHSPLLFEECQELCHPVCAHMVLVVTWGELQALETVEQHKQHHDNLGCHWPSSLWGFLSYCSTALFLL